MESVEYAMTRLESHPGTQVEQKIIVSWHRAPVIYREERGGGVLKYGIL
jgi:hypothetical protein